VSILSRLTVNRHLDDDVLAEIWTAAASDGTAATHPHLTSCAHCRTRYSVFSGWLEEIRLEAHAEADEAMSPERLAAQQAQIFRRLEALERPARIIAFPSFNRSSLGPRRMVPRWVPTAAAAGLIIGIATGQFLNLAHMRDSSPSPIPAVESVSASRPAGVQQAGFAADEALFYGDPEPGARSSTRYLPALDELTPRARDDYDRSR
jgi:hypothetical protein